MHPAKDTIPTMPGLLKHHGGTLILLTTADSKEFSFMWVLSVDDI